MKKYTCILALLIALMGLLFMACSDGSSEVTSITLSGTITVKDRGQTVPHVKILAHTDNYSWEQEVKVATSAANAPWSIKIKPFAVNTDIFFRVLGYEDPSYEGDLVFSIPVKNFKVTVKSSDKSGIHIDLANLKLIEISGKLNISGSPIPSVEIEIFSKKDEYLLGATPYLHNAGNNTDWKTKIDTLAENTDTFFQVVGSGSQDAWSEADRIFHCWGADFDVKVKDQDVKNIPLKFISVSGTIKINTEVPPTVKITIGADYFDPSDKNELGQQNYIWVTGIDLKPPYNNQQYSRIVPLLPSPKNNIKCWLHVTGYVNGESIWYNFEKEFQSVTGDITEVDFDEAEFDDYNGGGGSPIGGG